MKKSLRIVFVIAAFGVVMACAAASFGQRPIVGGYKTADVSADDVIAAGKFAVKAQNEKDDFGRTFIGVLSAEKQVVAGTNYRMCLKAKLGGDEGEINYVKVVVFMDLKKVYKLTSWADDKACADLDDETGDN